MKYELIQDANVSELLALAVAQHAAIQQWEATGHAACAEICAAHDAIEDWMVANIEVSS